MNANNSPYLFDNPNVAVNEAGDVVPYPGEPAPMNRFAADWELRQTHDTYDTAATATESAIQPKADEEMTLEELQAKYLDGALPSDDNREMWKPVERTELDVVAGAAKRAATPRKRLTIAQMNANERAHIARARRQRWGR